MTAKTTELVQAWRDQGPIVWAESRYGWIDIDGKPIHLEDWQRAVLSAWWNNRETCTTLAISNIKKTGKTFLNACLLAWRWLSLPGQHFAIGNDLDQAQARQFAMIAEMVKRHPYLSTVCKVYKNQLVFEPTNSTLTALASDAAGNAGANQLTSSHTEAWGIIYESGIRAYEEMTPPPGKFYSLPPLRVVDSYAGFEGESKTWHALVDRGLAGERISGDWPIYQVGGLLLFHMAGEEARARCFRGTQEEAAAYYGDQQRDLRPNAFIRMHSNERTAGESSFVDYASWEGCAGAEPWGPGERGRLVVGCDASTSRDYSSVVGSIYDHHTGIVSVRLVRVWKPRKIAGIRMGRPTIDLAETIGATVDELHKKHQLRAVVADPYQLHALIVEWEKQGIRVIELPQNSGRVDSDQLLYDLINSRMLRHPNDPELNQAIKNAVAVESARGFRLDKLKQSQKIDAAVACSMSCWGSRLYFGKQDDSGPGWIPDFTDGPPFPEVVAEWEFLAGRPWDEKNPVVDFRPHKEGVTHQNCRRKLCYACYAETQAERDTEAEVLAQITPMSEQEFNQWQESIRHPWQPPEPPVNQRVIREFWKSVKGR